MWKNVACKICVYCRGMKLCKRTSIKMISECGGPQEGRLRRSRLRQSLIFLGLRSFGLWFLGEEHCLDVGQHSALRYGDAAEELVQFLVVAHRELQMSGDDARPVVIPGRVTSQLQDLRRQVLHDSGQVHRRSCAHPFAVVAFLQETMHSSDRELEACSGRAALRLRWWWCAFSFATARHDRVKRGRIVFLLPAKKSL